MAGLELVGAEMLDRHPDVLLLAARVGEAEIDELDFPVLDQLENVLRGHHTLLVSRSNSGIQPVPTAFSRKCASGGRKERYCATRKKFFWRLDPRTRLVPAL
jgi:hypothetical protein